MKCAVCHQDLGPDRRTWCEHARAKFDEEYARLDAELEALQDSIRRSQVLTADDFNIRINCVAD